MDKVNNQQLISNIESAFPGKLLSVKENLGHAEISVDRSNLSEIMTTLRDDKKFDFKMLLSVTVTDYMDSEFMARPQAERYEVVYHLLSLSNLGRLRVKVAAPETDLKVASVTSLWAGAEIMESEAWDMYGVVFEGHPGLKRVLMYDEFKGHPLRKDYPLQAKQPRIPLLHPEVSNTARLMHRPELVQINKSQKSTGAA